jgi:multidrug efflux pump subunit AcrB
MLCILAVFIPAFFMTGAAKALFVPLALAVGFSMVASFILSSTLVPVLSIWFLRGHETKAALTPALAHPMGEGESSPVLRRFRCQAGKTGVSNFTALSAR